jgi:RNA polymerase sigma factor (sigma-70 family)
MAKRAAETLQRAIQAVGEQGTAALTDRDLLRRFAKTGDESAFSILFRRHVSMVLGVCRRVLPGVQDAEDACQATFLLLTRKAGTTRWQTSVANWLYLTARRVARNARLAAERRSRREQKAAVPELLTPVDRMTGRELLDALDAELDQLPPTYREPLVLCYLEGLTRDEAAQRLGLPASTVKIRLERGRKRLGEALTRRGCIAGAGLLALAATSPAGSPSLRIWEGVLAAVGGSASTNVVSLAASVAGSGSGRKGVIVAAALLGIGLIAVGGFSQSAETTNLRAEESPSADAEKLQAPPNVKREETPQSVSGIVVDADGKPVSGAVIGLAAEKRKSEPPFVELARTDAGGAFHCPTKPPDGRASEYPTLVARAPGYGPDWLRVEELNGSERVTFRLTPDDGPIRGRVLDLEGRPVRGATVYVKSVAASRSGSLAAFLEKWYQEPVLALKLLQKKLSSPQGIDLPEKVVSDNDGRFVIKSAGRGRVFDLQFEGAGIETLTALVIGLPRFVPSSPTSLAGSSIVRYHTYLPPVLYGPEFTHIARPDSPVTGVVTDATTGQPIAGARVTGRFQFNWADDYATIKTDAQGRFKLSGLAKSGRRRLTVSPPKDSLYLPAGSVVNESPGLAETVFDVQLSQGVVATGHVSDKADGTPIIGAEVSYTPLADNEFVSRVSSPTIFNWERYTVRTNESGDFRIVVLPGVGLITARMPDADSRRSLYLHGTLDPADEPRTTRVAPGAGGNYFRTADGRILGPFGFLAYKVIEPGERAESVKGDMSFARGKSVSGTVLNPEGKRAEGVLAYGLEPFFVKPEAVRDGTFTALALDASQPRTIAFIDSSRKLAGSVTLTGAEKTPPVVRLQPWSAVTGRILTQNKDFAAGLQINEWVYSPYPPYDDSQSGLRYATESIEAKSDARGRFRLDVPFADKPFRLSFSRFGQQVMEAIPGATKSIAPGQTVNVGDIHVRME